MSTHIPDRDEVMELVHHLHKGGDSEARKAMKPFVGTRNADLALPHLRRHAKRLLDDRSILLSRKLRDELKDFAVQFGLLVRGDAPMTAKFNMRFTQEQLTEIQKAAKQAGFRDASEFIRVTMVERARGILGTND
jgi:hypothetical protein